MLTRRAGLTLASAAIPAAMLAGCSHPTPPVKTLIAGVQAILDAFTANLPAALVAVSAATGRPIPAATTSTVRTVLTNLTTAANGVATVASVTDPTAQTKVQQFETALNTAVAIAATLPIPEPYHSALVLAVLTLPGLEALVELAIREGTALAATIATKRLSTP